MANGRSTRRSYWIGVISVLLIALAEDAVHAPIEDKSRFLVLLIPVAGSAWVGGMGPALLSLVLSCFVGVFLYLPPRYTLLVKSTADFASISLYIVVCLVLIAIIENLRRSKQALAESEAKVRALNSDLKGTLGLKEDALRRQKQFTADESHELKTPLTALRARSSIALSSPSKQEELTEHIIAMNRAAEIMNDVVQDLLLLAASDEGQLPLTKEPTFVQEMIEDALASIDSTKHRFTVAVEPALTIECDPSAVTRVLVNLLQNAVLHTLEEKQISVVCEESPKTIHITIQDEGSGISPEHLAHIFDRFYRADSSRDRHSGGSGLGLAIVKAIVDAHGGTIDISSEVDRGTTVNVILPN